MRVLLLCCILLTITACKKKTQEDIGTTTLQFRLIDSPALYEHVYLDIQQVQINHSSKGWVTVGPQVVGLYDILAYNNGFDTLFCNKSIEAGSFSQIRLILGTNNTIVVNGTTHNLTIPGSAQSGLKINVQQTLNKGETVVRWIDFDVAKSIIELGNNNYQLKPVLRSFNQNENGRIFGTILPGNAEPLVMAIKGNDTLTAIPETSGYFQFSGLNGNYDLHFIPYNSSYTGFSLLNQTVIGGGSLDLGLLSF